MLRPTPHHFTRGFTLIELIVVILLIAILGVTAASRFQSDDGFTEASWQKRILSAARNIQQQAMQNSLPGVCHRLLFDLVNGAYGPPARANSCATSIDFSRDNFLHSGPGGVAADGLILTGRDNNGSLLTILGFNHLGQPVGADGVTRVCLSGCEIRIIGESTRRVCIEPEGFLHTGVCGG